MNGISPSAKIANAYPSTPLRLNHWVDAPDFTPLNANPKQLEKLVVNPKRLPVLVPGEPFYLAVFKEKIKDRNYCRGYPAPGAPCTF